MKTQKPVEIKMVVGSTESLAARCEYLEKANRNLRAACEDQAAYIERFRRENMLISEFKGYFGGASDDPIEAEEERQESRVWRWQGDGYDFIRSMSSDLPVLITAGELRELLEHGESVAGDETRLRNCEEITTYLRQKILQDPIALYIYNETDETLAVRRSADEKVVLNIVEQFVSSVARVVDEWAKSNRAYNLQLFFERLHKGHSSRTYPRWKGKEMSELLIQNWLSPAASGSLEAAYSAARTEGIDKAIHSALNSFSIFADHNVG